MEIESVNDHIACNVTVQNHRELRSNRTVGAHHGINKKMLNVWKGGK